MLCLYICIKASCQGTCIKIVNKSFAKKSIYGVVAHLLVVLAVLPYSDKRKQLLKMTFLINTQNVSVLYIDISAISLCVDLNIF